MRDICPAERQDNAALNVYPKMFIWVLGRPWISHTIRTEATRKKSKNADHIRAATFALKNPRGYTRGKASGGFLMSMVSILDGKPLAFSIL
jgi:hypothetical protein